MNRFLIGFFFLVAGLAQGSNSRAGVIYFGGGGFKSVGSTGILQILFNTAPENYDFLHGGIDLNVYSSNSSILRFTGAQVINGGRWDHARGVVLLGEQISNLSAASLTSPGLPSGNAVVFAQVSYKVIGWGYTDLSIGVNTDGLYEDSFLPDPIGDVTGSFLFVERRVIGVPEPASVLFAGLSMLFCVGRRLSWARLL